MGFFDKVIKVTDKISNSIGNAATNIKEKYQEDGIASILDVTVDTLDNATKNTENYLSNISNKNGKIFDSENAVKSGIAVVVNTANILGTDLSNVTLKAGKAINDYINTEEEIDVPHYLHNIPVSSVLSAFGADIKGNGAYLKEQTKEILFQFDETNDWTFKVRSLTEDKSKDKLYNGHGAFKLAYDILESSDLNLKDPQKLTSSTLALLSDIYNKLQQQSTKDVKAKKEESTSKTTKKPAVKKTTTTKPRVRKTVSKPKPVVENATDSSSEPKKPTPRKRTIKP